MHFCVVDTKRQPSVSVAQVSIVLLFSQYFPSAAQLDEVHVQVGGPPSPDNPHF
jgi:hypothetical protein